MENRTGVVFPGQGCQRPGMGRDFYEAYGPSRDIYERASDALGMDVATLCFGDDERLGLTEFSQPAILTTEIAMVAGLEYQFGLTAQTWGGHSLGEYTALVASGALELEAAVRIVRERGRMMQEAVPVGVGGMVAVIGDEIDRDRLRGCFDSLQVELANDNEIGQVIVSGLVDDLAVVQERIRQAADTGADRFVELNVSAPFHCTLMESIGAPFRRVLEENRAGFDASRAGDVTCNVTGGFHECDESLIIDRLVEQLSGTVRWRDNMQALVERCTSFVEVGPGRPLRGFFRTIDVSVSGIISVRSAERAFARRLAS
jgi:[acyl-carrier-protein] S-malonyltransferase